EAALEQHQEDVKSRRLSTRDKVLGLGFFALAAVAGTASIHFAQQTSSERAGLVVMSLAKCNDEMISSANGLPPTQRGRNVITARSGWLYEGLDFLGMISLSKVHARNP